MTEQCVFCGTYTENPEEHHPNRFVDSQTTITLCKRCHQTYLKPLAYKVENAGKKIEVGTDGLAYCELGGHFTNLTNRVTVQHGYCKDSEFCWATECEYNLELDAQKENELTEKLTKDFFAAVVEGEEPGNIRKGEMALTDDKGNYWFERDDLVERLISLIEDDNERELFQEWYNSVDTTVEKQRHLDDFS